MRELKKPAVLQLRHNNSEGFVYAYEKDEMDKYLSEVDKVIAEKDKEIAELKADIADLRDDKKSTDTILDERNAEIVGLKVKIAGLQADYDEVRGRLQTANLIKDEQKAKADKLSSCLKCLVTRDLIKDCPEKDSAIEIVKEYDLW